MDKETIVDFMNKTVDEKYLVEIKNEIEHKKTQYNNTNNYLNYSIWDEKLKEVSLTKNSDKDFKDFMFYTHLIAHEMFKLNSIKQINFNKETRFYESIKDLSYVSKSIICDTLNLNYTNDKKVLLQNLLKVNLINIIAFGKNIFYYLRYIIWLSKYKNYLPEKINEMEKLKQKEKLMYNFGFTNDVIDNCLSSPTYFFIVCDRESRDFYLRDLNTINNKENDTIKIFPRKDNLKLNINLVINTPNFTDYLNIFKSADEFNQLYNDEIIFLNSTNIKIYIIDSSHYLTKGIGGKRAMINHYSYLLSENIFSREHFQETVASSLLLENYKNCLCIMQLDDNVTGIYELTTGLDAKGKKTHNPCKFNDAGSRSCPNIITKIGDIKDKGILENCNSYSIFTIYFLLKVECIPEFNISESENNDKIIVSNNKKIIVPLICGIKKGFGDRGNKKDLPDTLSKNNTYAIYKLTIQKPHLMYEYGYFYNPFNSRFIEDIVFNGLSDVIEKSLKLGNFYLRFGHYYSPKVVKPDNNDCFDKDIVDNLREDPITPIYGNYLMLYYYLKILEKAKLLKIEDYSLKPISPYSYNMKYVYNNKTHVVPMIKPTQENKYNWMHMMLYIMLNSQWFYDINSTIRIDNINNNFLCIFKEVINNERKIIELINQNNIILTNNLLLKENNEIKNYLVRQVFCYYNDKCNKSDPKPEPKPDESEKKRQRKQYNEKFYKEKYLKYKIKYFYLLKKMNK
jgi:hypothetical protein